MNNLVSNHDDYAITPVPEEEGKSWVEIALIVIGVGIAIPAFFLASLISGSLSVTESLIAIYGGGLLYTVFAVVMAVIGYNNRVSTYLLLKQVFGTKGYYPITILLTGILAFWFAFNLEVFAASLKVVFMEGIPGWLYVVLGGALMTTTASYGFKGLRALSVWAVPLLGVVLLLAVTKSIKYGSLSQQVGGEGSVGMFISVVAGTFMVGAALMPDIARYARSMKDAVKGALVGYLVAGPTILFVMTLLSMSTGQSDFFEVLQVLGLSGFGLVVLVLAAWTTNDNNAYSSSLALTALFPFVKKRVFVWMVGVLGTCIALFGVLGNFLSFVLLLGVLITPIIGVVGVDAVMRKDSSVAVAVNVHAIIAWVAGAVSAVMTTPTAALGLGYFTFTTIPSIDAVVIASVTYYVLRKCS